jgi:hypothetical protein
MQLSCRCSRGLHKHPRKEYSITLSIGLTNTPFTQMDPQTEDVRCIQRIRFFAITHDYGIWTLCSCTPALVFIEHFVRGLCVSLRLPGGDQNNRILYKLGKVVNSWIPEVSCLATLHARHSSDASCPDDWLIQDVLVTHWSINWWRSTPTIGHH